MKNSQNILIPSPVRISDIESKIESGLYTQISVEELRYLRDVKPSDYWKDKEINEKNGEVSVCKVAL